MARHPPTEGNDLKPRKVDAKEYYQNGEPMDTATQSASDPHGNEAHSEAFAFDGDGVQRRIWVIAAGAADPADAGPDDLIFEEEA